MHFLFLMLTLGLLMCSSVPRLHVREPYNRSFVVGFTNGIQNLLVTGCVNGGFVELRAITSCSLSVLLCCHHAECRILCHLLTSWDKCRATQYCYFVLVQRDATTTYIYRLATVNNCKTKTKTSNYFKDQDCISFVGCWVSMSFTGWAKTVNPYRSISKSLHT